MIDPERIPVIVGIGEAVDRPADVASALEPADIMRDAARRADADAGGGWLARIDDLAVVNCASWRYADLPLALAQRIGASPVRSHYTKVGGAIPGQLIHEAALRIARGEGAVSLICGAEAQHSVNRARAENVEPAWTPWAKGAARGQRGDEIVNPLAAAIGVFLPIHVYPLYDMAASASWGQSPAEALAESSELWARYAAVAMTNPSAWKPRACSPAEITTPSAANRPLAWPYTKLMTANPMVNQGAAVLVTSLAEARARGVPDARLIHIHGGAYAEEPRDFMARDQFRLSHAQDAVLAVARDFAPGGFDAMEIYSCFPSVPKMARRSLGLDADFSPTVTGGLTFFGAPLSNYMLHAACAMTRRLRAGGGVGLLYGQGEYVTHHHALVLGYDAPSSPLAETYSVQAAADARRGPVPQIVAPEVGPATVETATVLFERDGGVSHGAVVLALPGGRRTIARVDAGDAASISAIMDADRWIVGRGGHIVAGPDEALCWRIAD